MLCLVSCICDVFRTITVGGVPTRARDGPLSTLCQDNCFFDASDNSSSDTVSSMNGDAVIDIRCDLAAVLQLGSGQGNELPVRLFPCCFFQAFVHHRYVSPFCRMLRRTTNSQSHSTVRRQTVSTQEYVPKRSSLFISLARALPPRSVVSHLV